jgi:hypothetical protein
VGAWIFPGESPVAWLYGSTNSGETWTTLLTVPLVGLSSVACSASGAIVAASTQLVAFSTNGGAAWSFDGTPYGDGSIAVSANGKTMISSGSSQEYEVSPNTGASWYTPNPPNLSGSVTSSSDGNTLAILDSYNDLIYLSVPPPSQEASIAVVTNSSQGMPTFQLTGQPGYTYIIQASTNLVNWVNLTTLVNTNGTVTFTDPSTTNYPQRYYRAVAP